MKSMDPVASTAHWVAAARARESQRGDALFHDPFAAALAGDEGRRWMDGDEGLVATYVAIRTRFFDEELERAASSGVRQIVILAAGLDARAYRMNWPAGTRLFELDRPEVLAHKDRILDAAGAAPRCARVAIGLDLTLPWAESLRDAGFVSGARTAWLVEGLLPYLREVDVRRLLTQVSALSAVGSALAFDCAGVDPFSVEGFSCETEKLRARGIRMHFFCDDPASLLAPFGFSAEDHSFGELAERVGREMPRGAAEVAARLHGHLISASRRAA